MAKEGMSLHYWQIHKRIAIKELDRVPKQMREIISDDSDSSEAQWFSRHCESEAMKIYLDEAHPQNNPDRFKYPYRD